MNKLLIFDEKEIKSNRLRDWKAHGRRWEDNEHGRCDCKADWIRHRRARSSTVYCRCERRSFERRWRWRSGTCASIRRICRDTNKFWEGRECPGKGTPDRSAEVLSCGSIWAEPTGILPGRNRTTSSDDRKRPGRSSSSGRWGDPSGNGTKIRSRRCHLLPARTSRKCCHQTAWGRQSRDPCTFLRLCRSWGCGCSRRNAPSCTDSVAKHRASTNLLAAKY